jgi:hypothetical protein
MSEEEDYPEIGDRRKGRILVCMGDDRPDQWADWLELLVAEFKELEAVAEEHSLRLDSRPTAGQIEDWRDFCEAIGVCIESRVWEGSMISGQWQMGWVEVGTIRRAKKAGREILKRLREDLIEQIREAGIREVNEQLAIHRQLNPPREGKDR